MVRWSSTSVVNELSIALATDTWKNDLGRSELDKRLYYVKQYSAYRIVGWDFNRSLRRKSSDAQIVEIEEVKLVQKALYLLYTSLLRWDFTIL